MNAEARRLRLHLTPEIKETGMEDLASKGGGPSRFSEFVHGIWAWAFVGQGISSATTFGLVVLAGRSLGASALGVVVIGLGSYFMLLLIQRALVITPLISSSSTLVGSERASATRAAVTVTLIIGCAGAGLFAIIGASVGGPIGDGMLVFAPWVVPALAQDLFRSTLFRDGRGRRGSITDIAWFGLLLTCAPFAVWIGEVWAVVGAWGVGAIVAASLGAVATRVKPAPFLSAQKWFVHTAFPFGRWLVLQEGSFVIGFYGLVLLLTPIIGAAGLGGLRAAETIFAPMSLVGPALVLVGLPAVSRAVARSRESAVRLAVGISGACGVLIVVYAIVMIVAGSRILTLVFGDSFASYDALVIPMSLWQLALATGLGFTILLRAEQRGRALLLAGTSMAVIALVLSPVAAHVGGVEGAVWGYVAGAVAHLLFVSWFAFSPQKVNRS